MLQSGARTGYSDQSQFALDAGIPSGERNAQSNELQSMNSTLGNPNFGNADSGNAHFGNPDPPRLRSTTILLVRRKGEVCLAGDGQVTMNDTVVKSGARKVLRTQNDEALVGFAGGAADGLALFSRFEGKLQEYQGNLERASVELAKDWRTDRALRQLQAQMIVTDAGQSFLVSGNGDLMAPDEDGLLSIGSGSNIALGAARALIKHTDLSAQEIAVEALTIAASICVYTNDQLTIEVLSADD